jgi:hypothetical protein
MSELERIKNIEERIALAGLLPGVNLGWLPHGEAAKLKRAVLDLYRIGHANGFKAGVTHATTAVAVVIPPRRDSLQTQWPMRWLSARMRERWQEFKKSLRLIRVAIIIGAPRARDRQGNLGESEDQEARLSALVAPFGRNDPA